MTSLFRIDQVSIVTDSGTSDIDFSAPLTVLAGPVGVGKSTLLELMKFGLGGAGVLADVVTKHVIEVRLIVSVGTRRLALSRQVGSKASKSVNVVDLLTNQKITNLRLDDKEPNLSELLLDSLGIPSDVRAASDSVRSTNAGARVTFFDVLHYLYVPQSKINQDIASSDDNYYTPKRKVVFDLLFGLTDRETLGLRTRISLLRADLDEATREYDIVLKFLVDSNTPSRFDAVRLQFEFQRDRDEAERDLSDLRADLEPSIDRETQTLTDLLKESISDYQSLQVRATSLRQQRLDFDAEHQSLASDFQRLERTTLASSRVAIIEFATCPRCLQSVSHRDVDPGHCTLCTQPDPADGADLGLYVDREREQILEQMSELDQQRFDLSDQLDAVVSTLQARESLIRNLSTSIDERTNSLISPRLRSFEDATQRSSAAKTALQDLEQTLRQWDRADDLERVVIEHRGRLNDATQALELSLAALEQRRSEILSELGEEFESVVRAIEIPGVSAASIDPKTYLPTLDGVPFGKFSPAGGGIRTATQIAYWVALLTVALRRRDTDYPAFLMIDSPRLSLNNANKLAEALYRRLTTLVDVAAGRMQVIIADNELPAEYTRNHTELDFDFSHPTIASIEHPGPTKVKTIE
jgi:hypothetical protein